MKIAAAINRLTLMLVPKKKRFTLRDGYFTLVHLGWPTEIITKKMCDKAEAGVMRRHMGVQSWIAYKQEWEWAENGTVVSGKTPTSESAAIIKISNLIHRLRRDSSTRQSSRPRGLSNPPHDAISCLLRARWEPQWVSQVV